MEWTAEQEQALHRVAAWRRDPNAQQVFYLAGYAGTGKTTLARHFAEAEHDPWFGAYTGKAAHVLRKKGCPARTIHSMIYVPKDKSKQRLRTMEQTLADILAGLRPEQRERGTPETARLQLDIEAERDNLARPAFTLNLDSGIRDASLIIIDECSMVGAQMGADLLSFGRPVLVLGDPAQLPPVGDGGYFTDRTPDIMLTDIKRQALDNPILALAQRVREGLPLAVGQYGESRVLAAGSQLDNALTTDQIIVGKNATRHGFNRRCRALLGRTHELPQTGDKVVCLRNDHDEGLLNGQLWEVAETHGLEGYVTMELRSLDEPERLSIVVEAHREPFLAQKVPTWSRRDAQEFDYGYALTCHKSQGSQWDDVVIKDEGAVFREDRNRWLYTAITRAAERVTILQT